MATERDDENQLKQCLSSIISESSKVLADLQHQSAGSNEKQLLDNLQRKVETILNDNCKSLSSDYQGYLIDILKQHNCTIHQNRFAIAFNKKTLPTFIKDIKGRLGLLNASQAAWVGNRASVQSFITDFPELRDQSGHRGTTLLYSAARNGHLDLVKYLLENGHCFVNVQNQSYDLDHQGRGLKASVGSTALHAACYHGHLHVVVYLVEHGGDYYVLNEALETPVDNAQPHTNTKQFFSELLLNSYTRDLKTTPRITTLNEIERAKQPIVDCVWEYKPLIQNRWLSFTPEASELLQKALTVNDSNNFIADVLMPRAREQHTVSIVQFLRSGSNKDQLAQSAWVRCRGSSLLNFQCFAHWQMMFTKHPSSVTDPTYSVEIFSVLKNNNIQLNSWYDLAPKLNIIFETAMNYHRRSIVITFENLNGENITFDLESFSFTNQQNTMEGHIRWIPKYAMRNKKFSIVNNFKVTPDASLVLITPPYLKWASGSGNISANEMSQFELKYENMLNVKVADTSAKPIVQFKSSNPLIEVVSGNLLRERTDVMVVCRSSKHLVQEVFNVVGKSIDQEFRRKMGEHSNHGVTSIRTEGKLAAKVIYFVDWVPDNDQTKLAKSIEKMFSDVMQTAISENYKIIAFPAIGCGDFACPIDLVARTLVQCAQVSSTQHQIQIKFVIHPDRQDIYSQFLFAASSSEEGDYVQTSNALLIKVGQARIEVIQGNIAKQNTDVIVGSSSSENLRQFLLQEAGKESMKAYQQAYTDNPNALFVSIPGGRLRCKKIVFVKWEPSADSEMLRQSIVDLMWNVIQNTLSYGFSSISFPAIGCGEHDCSVDIVVKTMVREMKQQIQNRKLPWNIRFVIEPSQKLIYDEFGRRLLELNQDPVGLAFPETWVASKDGKMKFEVSKASNEYKSTMHEFESKMKGVYSEIVRLQRIQNERWYMQFIAHARDFRQRLNKDTEKLLYHGCPDGAADLIIQDCFNRSFAGVNGTAYGVGVYFSSDPTYSHGYTRVNANGERCMFIARVLIGNTTRGNSSMKTRPVGFDSTTDERHIFVTYHDAQAYAAYLITYK